MEKTTTSLSKQFQQASQSNVVHSTEHYEVRIVTIDLGKDAALAALARKYAVVHKAHEVVHMVSELLPQAIAACAGLESSLEAALTGIVPGSMLKPPGGVN